MKRIGRRLFYNLLDGLIIQDAGERQGDVIETSYLTDFPAYDVSIHGVIGLSYSERSEEFNNMGTYKVVNDQLVIYPKVAIQSDKQTILNDGVDTAIITATVTEDMTLVFTVFDTNYSVDTVNGVGSLEVTTTAIGEITVSVVAGKFGSNAVTVKGVDTIA